jgi:preprotein translocase subunit SecG
MWNVVLPILLFLTSVFLILLVLIQRGRGGGLAGAFGGLGGQSAFGTKAGDLFTRITIGVAAFWIILCAASVKLLNDSSTSIIDPTLGGAPSVAPRGTSDDKSTPATDADKSVTPPAGSESSAPAATTTPATDAAPAATATPAESPAPAESAPPTDGAAPEKPK